jgi:membrane fusion protein (multidrug efflux system)
MSKLARGLGALAFVGTILPGISSGAPADDAAREIRVQVVAETSATIGAPMSGRLTQFPLHDGERFKQGDVLAKFFCAEKEGTLSHARAVLEGRREVFASKQKLHSLGTSSEVEYRVAEADAAEAAADVQTAQAATDSCVVTAPFTGRVATIFTHNFQFLATGAPLIEILSDKDLNLELILPSQWLAWLKPGTPFQVTIDESGKTYAAQLTRLSGKVDAVSRSIKVYGHIDQPDDALLPGMSGQARFSPPGGDTTTAPK